MLSLYEILKASKTGIAPDMWTALAGMNWGGKDSGHEVKELTGIPPLSFTADGTPLLDYLISGNMSQSDTPSPDNPIQPSECGELETNLAIISGDSRTIENWYYMNVRISDNLEAGIYTISYVIDEKTGNASASTVGFGTLNVYQRDFKIFSVGNVPITITATVTLESEGYLWARFLRANSPTNFSYSVSHVRVEKGSHSYGYKIPISSGGENLWDGNYENGLINTDGTLNAPDDNYNTTMYIPTEEKNYTLSVICNYDSGLRLLRVCFYDENKNFISYVNSPGFQGKDFFYKFNFTAPVNSKYLRFSYIFRVGMSDTNIMLNRGNTALPYEPYNRTTTPIYLGEVPTTRRIKKLVFDGTENWLVLDVYYTVSAPNVRPWGGCICTHCAYSGIIGGNSNTRLWVKQASFPDCQTLEDFKSYLVAQYAAGTPVTVWYSTAEPETGIVNEPLRKIGDYADTLSMEQAGVQIPTLHGNTVIDVETTLKPSEMYIKYQE